MLIFWSHFGVISNQIWGLDARTNGQDKILKDDQLDTKNNKIICFKKYLLFYQIEHKRNDAIASGIQRLSSNLKRNIAQVLVSFQCHLAADLESWCVYQWARRDPQRRAIGHKKLQLI